MYTEEEVRSMRKMETCNIRSEMRVHLEGEETKGLMTELKRTWTRGESCGLRD